MWHTPCPGTVSLGAPPAPCCDAQYAPQDIAAERNRYFTGKYMTERDFQQEQWYFLSHARLHQRALHGWGVVCGLEVEKHPADSCAREGWVVVLPGIAIDGYGRTIVVREKTAVHLKALPRALNNPDLRPTGFLGIRYKEECIEQVPLLYDEHGCGQRMVHNRIAESAGFAWIAEEEIGTGWKVKKASDPCQPCSPPAGCLAPDLPCGGVVPLALVQTPIDGSQPWAITPDHLNFDGVSYLPGPLAPKTLTHICQTSWTHGATVKLSDLTGDARMGPTGPAESGKASTVVPERPSLWVKFDRRLKPGPNTGDAAGLSAQTFVVEFIDDHGTRRLLPPVELRVEEEPRAGCQTGLSKVTYALDSKDCGHVHSLLKALSCRPVVVHVTLKCDFLQDYRGRAVDGNFLKGVFPTGDGIEGGTFESWFTLDKQGDCGGTR